MISQIDRAELKHKIESAEPFILLEVLPQEEYAKEHLPGALHLPPDSVRQIAPTLIPNRQTEIVVYCANSACDASSRAAEVLDQIAYARVRHYEGGKADWVEAGLPTEPTRS